MPRRQLLYTAGLIVCLAVGYAAGATASRPSRAPHADALSGHRGRLEAMAAAVERAVAANEAGDREVTRSHLNVLKHNIRWAILSLDPNAGPPSPHIGPREPGT